MPLDPDAFRHHPELAEIVRDPEESFFRDFDLEEMDRRLEETGNRPAGWRYADEDREARRRATLDGRRDAPLWILAYGSLIWDPAILFDEVRHARVEGWHRSFCLLDTGARGSEAEPGLMAGLDAGGACDALVLRLPPERIEEETFRLWKREMVAPGYDPVFVTAQTAQGPVEALAFTVDPSQENMLTGLTLAQQADYIARGEGFLGTNLEYLDNLLRHFRAAGVTDPQLEELRRLVEERRSPAAPAGGSPS